MRMRSKLLAAVAACLLSGPAFAQQGQYASPQAALDAMISALRAADKNAVLGVFGAEAADYLSDGDPVEDRINRLTLLGLYEEGYRFVPQPDGSVLIALGAEGWLFPVPIASQDGSWAFDNDAGREEVRLREIGLNEIDVVELLQAYVTIQAEFRRADPNGDGVMEFAGQIIASDETARDGLFWADEDSPLGELFARAAATGYNDGASDQPPEPFSGYYYRILTAQTDAAPGGAMSYIINGHMLGGHALLAVPAVYGETGVHSFMVSENGIVLEAVLGEDTLEIAAGMAAYDPTPDWTPVELE